MPGSDAKTEEELTELFKIGFKDVEGLGKALKDKLDEQEEDSEDAFQRRLEIWH